MLKNLAIDVKNLKKCYPLLHDRSSWIRFFLHPSQNFPTYTALKNVSFSLPSGSSLGIVGDNGAGKSTLLKILCGVTNPTVGKVKVCGLVGSLLELGSGFHPEFSGRENIYFSGSLLGFTRQQIRGLEEQILEFSELQEFIDKPLKTYSTGMFLRLGFAVATGFSPKVLIIDEALAVGDQLFQKKCTDRILSFRENGTTIIFCSHNLTQVKSLCSQALWLDKGIVVRSGGADQVVDAYRDYCRSKTPKNSLNSNSSLDKPSTNRSGSTIERVKLSGTPSGTDQVFRPGDSLQLEVWAHFPKRKTDKPGIGIALIRNDGLLVYATTTNIDSVQLQETTPEIYKVVFCLPEIQLLSGRYAFNVFTTDSSSMQSYNGMEGVEEFCISSTSVERGIARIQHYWE